MNESKPDETLSDAASAAAPAHVNGSSANGESADSKSLSPPALAHKLFEMALPQCKGNPAEASMQVTRYLTEALLFTISVSAADNELARMRLLKHVAEEIMSSPLHPMVAKFTARP